MFATAIAAIALVQPNAVLRWNAVTLEAITVNKPSPPVGARLLAMVHTATYDAWTAYDDKAVPVYSALVRVPASRRSEAAKEAAISAAAHSILSDIFPADKERFDKALAAESAKSNEGTLVGRLAAQAVLEYCHQDGSNQLNGYADTSGYKPVNAVDKVNDPNRWQPQEFVHPDGTITVPGFVTPHWGKVKSFSIPDIAAVRAPAPPAYGTPEYKRQVDEIIFLTANLTEEQKVIAEYWADGPKSVLPPGHWNIFGAVVSQRDQHTLEQDVKMFFMLGNAVNDAGICCWDTKVAYDYVRPITAIRHLYKGQTIKGWRGPGKGFGDIPAEKWVPYQPASFITPPFAEYTSGHSTFSGASAEVLRRFTGSDRFGYSVTYQIGSLATEPGFAPSQPITLVWPTFTAAADQAGMSRRWGGIHFESGDLLARKMGKNIGSMVWEKAQTYFNGTAQR